MSDSSISIQFTSDFLENSLKEIKADSSLFMCLSYYLFEALIRLKSSPEVNESFYQNLINIFQSASEYISTLELNPSILLNFQQMAEQIFNEPSPSIAFGYLRYYFGCINPECLIVINYGMRLIIVFLLNDFQEKQIAIINRTSFDWYKSIEVFGQAFRVQVAIIQDPEYILFPIVQSASYLNVFLHNEKGVFSILCTDDYFTLFEKDEYYENDNFEVPVLYVEKDLSKIFCSKPYQKDKVAKFKYNEEKKREKTESNGFERSENENQKVPLTSPASTSRSNRRRIKFSCTKEELTELIELIKSCLKLDGLGDQSTNNMLSEEKTPETISLRKIHEVFIQFIPDKLFNIRFLRLLSKKMHAVFKTSQLTRSERVEILQTVTQLKTCLICKASSIKIIELLIKCFVSRKSMFKTVLRVESNRKK